LQERIKGEVRKALHAVKGYSAPVGNGPDSAWVKSNLKPADLVSLREAWEVRVKVFLPHSEDGTPVLVVKYTVHASAEEREAMEENLAQRYCEADRTKFLPNQVAKGAKTGRLLQTKANPKPKSPR